MTPAESRDARYRALADPIRRRLLRLLADAAEPCDVETLAGRVNLHPNTVRGHLDLLERAELVVRATRPRDRPGRPRVVYSAAPDAADPGSSAYRLLADLLAEAVCCAGGDPRQAAEEAGRAWGRRRALSGAEAEGHEEVGDRLLAFLDELGFEPSAQRQDGTMVIDLTDCPFRDLVERHAEVVCSLHMGLMRGLVETAGDGYVEGLHPFVEPSLCRTVVRAGRGRLEAGSPI
ncbi:MAG: helix-turn-helix transcriptional regulator [bacterium]